MFIRAARFVTHPLLVIGAGGFIMWWFPTHARDVHPLMYGGLALFVIIGGLRLRQLLPSARRRSKLPRTRVVGFSLVRVVVKRPWRPLSPREAAMRRRLSPQLRLLLSRQERTIRHAISSTPI